MNVLSVIGKMGMGKTGLATTLAEQYRIKNPNNIIYANYHINLTNVVYTPLLFLPFESLHDCMIIADDFYALDNVDSLIAIIVNVSRKNDVFIILTCQYYSMIKPKIRELSEIIDLSLDKEKDILHIKRLDLDNIIHYYKKRNFIKEIKDVYNTKEIVKFSTDMLLRTEILKFSENFDMLEYNIHIAVKNKVERKNLMKELLPFLNNLKRYLAFKQQI